MIPLKFFNKSEKEKLLGQLEEQFGITEIPWKIAHLGKERIVLFSGDLSENEIFKIDDIARIEGVGIYFAKIDEKTGDIRLSIEGTQILKKQINKGIFEMNEKQKDDWIKGRELNISTGKKQFLVMKYKEDFLGCGKASAEKITNFIPKTRRLREKI